MHNLTFSVLRKKHVVADIFSIVGCSGGLHASQSQGHGCREENIFVIFSPAERSFWSVLENPPEFIFLLINPRKRVNSVSTSCL
ncbi:UNVERIFIED_CONTAM: hypothetical protein NCL1_07627 [Trichonephila clavipes]